MKQWFTLDRNEWLVIIASYPVVVIVNYLMLRDPYFAHSYLFLSITAITTILYLTFAWLMDVRKKFVHHHYPSVSQSTRRITLSILSYIAFTFVLVALIFWVYKQFNIPGYRFRLANFGWAMLIGVTLNILSAGIFEALYFHGQWRGSLEREYCCLLLDTYNIKIYYN